jgi:hypothetical protein
MRQRNNSACRSTFFLSQECPQTKYQIRTAGQLERDASPLSFALSADEVESDRAAIEICIVAHRDVDL